MTKTDLKNFFVCSLNDWAEMSNIIEMQTVEWPIQLKMNAFCFFFIKVYKSLFQNHFYSKYIGNTWYFISFLCKVRCIVSLIWNHKMFTYIVIVTPVRWRTKKWLSEIITTIFDIKCPINHLPCNFKDT